MHTVYYLLFIYTEGSQAAKLARELVLSWLGMCYTVLTGIRKTESSSLTFHCPGVYVDSGSGLLFSNLQRTEMNPLIAQYSI